MEKIAFVTQSYRADLAECTLLCQSIDRFAPGIDHFIFVNDEDVNLFAHMKASHRFILPKKIVAPKGFFKFPWKVAGHRYHVSPFSIPMREWIFQQICKLAVFEAIGEDYHAVFHIDSEIVFMKPFDHSKWIHPDGRFMMYCVENHGEPSHDEYCRAAERLLPIQKNLDTTWHYNYMCQPTCFVRSNLNQLLTSLQRHSIFPSWKYALSNTYRFSEYYLYNIFTQGILGGANHFQITKRPFPVVDICDINSPQKFRKAAIEKLADNDIIGLWLQKRERKNLSGTYLPAEVISETIKQMWDEASD